MIIFEEDRSDGVAPNHYTRWAIQPIDFIRANKLAFDQANIIKYVMRHDHKNGLEDLLKARQYLDWMIEDYYGERPEPCEVHPIKGQVRDSVDECSHDPIPDERSRDMGQSSTPEWGVFLYSTRERNKGGPNQD